MKILYIAPLSSRHSRRWIAYFAESGHKVHAIDTDNYEEEKLSNVTYHSIDLNRKSFLKYLVIRSELKKIISTVKPNIIHVHWVGVYAYLVTKLNFHPVIVTAWGSDILVLPKKSLIKRFFVKKVLKSVDVITCDAEHLRDEMVRMGADGSKVRIIYFGTDVSKFNPDKKDVDLSKELGFANKAPLIISLRALELIYDVETFIKAIPLVLEEQNDARFIIIGEGSEKNKLMQMAEKLSVNDKVRFAGYLSDDDMQRYIASSSIYISTSLSDAGLAASTAEAMSSGVPAVITDFGNNDKWVKHGVSGLLFELKDYKTLASHIVKLLKDRQLAAELGQKGMQIIRERNNWQIEMQKVESLYMQYKFS